MRKHAESNINNWPDYIMSVQLAYNSKVHSTTGYTPFELVFGRKMTEFTNWKNKLSIEESIALDKRAEEIKDLIHNK